MADALTVVQDLYGAFASGDMDAAMAILSEDLAFELGGTSRFSGRHEGRERVLALQGELMSMTGMTNEVVGMYAGDDGVVIHQRGHARDGYEDEALLLITVTDDRVTSIREFLLDPAAFDELVK